MAALAWAPRWQPPNPLPGGWRPQLARAGTGLGHWLPLHETDRRLVWAGRPFGLQAGEFWLLRLFAALAGGALGLAVHPALAFICLGAGLMAPGLWLQSRVQRRQGELQRELLPILDLWAAAVEAGLPPVPALNRVCERMGGLLAGEFAQAAREVITGRPLRDALLALSERTGLEELDLVVKTLVQAERYGTPLSRLVREMVSQMRVERRHQAQAVAGRAAIRMMIPMLLFIFAPFLVLLLAPALWHLRGALQ